MVYLFGTIGFIAGFIIGQMVLYFFLRNKTNRELVEDKSLKTKYGLLNWGLAILFSYIFVQIFYEYQRLDM